MTEAEPYRFSELAPGDVVQLDPESDLGKCWGPQFVVVEDVRPWGFQGYFTHAEKRGDFGAAYLRVKTGTFARIGRAEWVVLDSSSRETAADD